jgi:hypothetical protein
LRARQDVHGCFHFLGGEVVAVRVRHVLVWLEAVVGAEGLRPASISSFVTRDVARALECNINQSEADLIGGRGSLR